MISSWKFIFECILDSCLLLALGSCLFKTCSRLLNLVVDSLLILNKILNKIPVSMETLVKRPNSKNIFITVSPLLIQPMFMLESLQNFAYFLHDKVKL